MDRPESWAVHSGQHEALLLLLERRAPGNRQPCAGGFSQLFVSGEFGARDLGAGARTGPKEAWSMAFRRAAADLSDDLLLCVSACALPACDRAGVVDAGGLSDLAGILAREANRRSELTSLRVPPVEYSV